MKRIAIVATLLLVATAYLQAKGPTVRIDVAGESLAGVVRVTDGSVHEFDVWEGPGVNGTGWRDGHGFIADWQAGPVTPPAGTQPIDVSFYIACKTGADCVDGALMVYGVSYAVSASDSRGFVYIPGRDDERFAINTRSILRGAQVEGHWFAATQAWDQFMAAQIASNRRQ